MFRKGLFFEHDNQEHCQINIRMVYFMPREGSARMCRVLPMNIGTRQIHVAEIKQKYIQNIIDAAHQCDLIDRVVLFGSSLEERCREASDIDIAVFGNLPRSRALTSKKYERFARRLYAFDNYSQAYDILYFRNNSDDSNPILHEISKGEELYARN